jgi:hypothetical protein
MQPWLWGNMLADRYISMYIYIYIPLPPIPNLLIYVYIYPANPYIYPIPTYIYSYKVLIMQPWLWGHMLADRYIYIYPYPL